MFACYIGAYALVGPDSLDIFLFYDGGMERVLFVVASVLLGVYLNDLYSELRVISRLRLVQQYCLVLGMAFLAQSLASYVSKDMVLGRWHMMVGSGLALAILPAWRFAYDLLFIRSHNRQRILFLGANNLVKAIVKTIHEKPQFGMSCVGYLSDVQAEEEFTRQVPYLGQVCDLLPIYEEHKPSMIVVGLPEQRDRMPLQELLDLRVAGVPVEDSSYLYETMLWRVSLEALRPSQLLFSNSIGPNARNLAIQRLYSTVISLIGLLIALPVMAIVWVLVRVTSPGKALYSQRRVGINGKEFFVYKFRSMYIDAEARTGAVWAQKNDPRVTPLGYWLRKLRLDELPQFFNVIRGDMAIVGPRPERPEFVKVLSEKIPFYNQRHAILPGITGWAQINHKYGDTVEDTITKLEYDLYYLKHLSLSLDMYIIFHTAKVMLLSKGSQ
ncbi:sugar transferase [Paludibaculum fermentans]|uniref:Sugar transferase n=1 Tax=Paludibaculum fermentans TaxID=1473598 RepID=A0A7S7NUZ4_PALFE|nr:sugar transferase [Paludibaculum fermentans]QOY90221.1 sugar transferase [Paludibaculum fermentans]